MGLPLVLFANFFRVKMKSFIQVLFVMLLVVVVVEGSTNSTDWEDYLYDWLIEILCLDGKRCRWQLGQNQLILSFLYFSLLIQTIDKI